MILIDTNAAIDALNPSARDHAWALDRLDEATRAGTAFTNLVVVAELAARTDTIERLQALLAILEVPVVAFDELVSFEAGRAFARWIDRGGRRGGVLPDFLIGAHAHVVGASILTRDPRRFRSYFPDVPLILPEPEDD